MESEEVIESKQRKVEIVEGQRKVETVEAPRGPLSYPLEVSWRDGCSHVGHNCCVTVRSPKGSLGGVR
jgi:hypothetical protein